MNDSTTPADDIWTVQRILRWTTEFLEQKKVESPRLEAELLLAHARNCQRIHLYTDFEQPLTDSERSRMRDFVKRRSQREPLAYITGHKEFYGREFSVGAGVLIPRPETELLIDICLERLSETASPRICEVGFGSGCISITLAKQKPDLQVDATDTSRDALTFADANVRKHGVESRVHLHTGDLLTPLPPDLQFDGLVSNPPYIRQDELTTLAPEVAQHEPVEALVSGHDGLDIIRQLVSDAPQILRPGAWIALELDPAQSTETESLMNHAGFTDIRTHKDFSGHDRVVSAALPTEAGSR